MDLRLLKRLVRDSLPEPAYDSLRRLVHERRLSRAPTMAVDTAPLPRAVDVSLPEMLRGDGIADDWERAKASIAEVFEDAPGNHGIDPESRRTIYHLIRRFQPRSLLEIGTNHGASTLSGAMAMREYRNGSFPRLVTVDLFDVNNPATAEAKRYRISTPPREILARLDCADMVEFAVARSTDYLSGREREFDFILLDHTPSADIAYRDIALAIGALRPGGQLLLHSYFPGGKPLGTGERVNPGFYLAVRRLRREGVGLEALPLSKQGKSSLALLARV